MIKLGKIKNKQAIFEFQITKRTKNGRDLTHSYDQTRFTNIKNICTTQNANKKSIIQRLRTDLGL